MMIFKEKFKIKINTLQINYINIIFYTIIYYFISIYYIKIKFMLFKNNFVHIKENNTSLDYKFYFILLN